MALPVLDGNQTATTLSSVVTGGEHIVAHTVVSLGSTAISNITNAVSGSVVSISNFPSTQTIAGTVTANVPFVNDDFSTTTLGAIKAGLFYQDTSGGNGLIAVGNDSDQGLPIRLTDSQAAIRIDGSAVTQPISGTVTVGNSVTVAGTVTANTNYDKLYNIYESPPGKAIQIGYADTGNFFVNVRHNNGFPVQVVSQGSVTIGSVPNGSLTTRFGTPTTANTAFATSAVTNASRKYLLIQNVTTGSNVITVGIGFTPTTTQGIQLTAGAGITFESSYIPTGAVYVLSSVTASNFTVLEA